MPDELHNGAGMQWAEFPESAAPRDTLTIRFERDMPGPAFTGAEPKSWMAVVGENLHEGIAGFGASPLLALRDLCERIALAEGCRTDNGLLPLR